MFSIDTEFIDRSTSYFVLRWAEKRYKEKMVGSLSSKELQCISSTVLLISLISDIEVESCINDDTFLTILRIVANHHENGTEEKTLESLWKHNLHKLRRRLRYKLKKVQKDNLPAAKQKQVKTLLARKQNIDPIIKAYYNNHPPPEVTCAENQLQSASFIAHTYHPYLITQDTLQRNSELVPLVACSLYRPEFMLQDSGIYQIPSGSIFAWYQSIPAYELKYYIEDETCVNWLELYQKSKKVVSELLEIPFLPLRKWSTAINEVYDNIDSERYISATVTGMSVIEGLIWDLCPIINHIQPVLANGDRYYVDIRTQKPFHCKRVRELLERTALSQHLDQGFLKYFCNQLYEKRNPIMHGQNLDTLDRQAAYNLAFTIEYLLHETYSLAEKRLFEQFDKTISPQSTKKIMHAIKVLHQKHSE